MQAFDTIVKFSNSSKTVEIHRELLSDETASWAVAYKNVLWKKIVPGKSGVEVTICGDDVAKEAIAGEIH